MPDSRFFRRRLPHWHVDGAAYFVTWCLRRDQPILRAPERTLVVRALRYFDGDRYVLHAWVVMHDHVHVILEPRSPHRLSNVLRSIKGYTGWRLARITERRTPVWQDESYDRVVRDEREMVAFRRYILHNPRRRWPGLDQYLWAGLRGRPEGLPHAP